MDYFIKNAFASIQKIGVDLKSCKISNIEAADKICRVLCDVAMFDYGSKATEEVQAIRKEFEV